MACGHWLENPIYQYINYRCLPNRLDGVEHVGHLRISNEYLTRQNYYRLSVQHILLGVFLKMMESGSCLHEACEMQTSTRLYRLWGYKQCPFKIRRKTMYMIIASLSGQDLVSRRMDAV